MNTLIDYTLLHRRQVLNYLNEILADSEIRNWEVDQILEEMMQLECDVGFILLNQLTRSKDEREIQLIAYALAYLQDDQILSDLVNLLVDPHIDPTVKYALIPTFVSYGIQPTDPDFSHIFESAFGDITAIIQQSTEDIIESLGGRKREETISFLVDSYSVLPPEAQLSFLKHFGETKDPKVVEFLEIMIQQEQEETAKSAARYLGQIKSPISLSSLIRLRSEIQSESLKAVVDKAIQFLRMSGIQPQQVTPRQPKLGKINKVIITHFDNTGSRILLFSRYAGGKHKIDSVNFMITTTEGVIDCFGINRQTEAEFDELVESIVREVGFDEVSYEYAISILRDALYVNRQKETLIPANFFLFKQCFSDVDLTPCAYQIDWERYGWNVDSIANDQRLLRESAYLFALDEFYHWQDHSDATRRYGLKLGQISKRHIGKRLELETHQLYKSYAAEVMAPQLKLIQQNLFFAADLLAQRAETVKEAKVALAAALTLNSTNLGSHPFICGMIDESLNRVMEESELLLEDSDVTILGDNILDDLGRPTVPLVNINTATTEELVMLPWVGANMASRIINARPYNRIEDLLEVAGIGPSRFNDIKNLVTVKQQDSK